ncbi:MAG: AAA family ATPase [Erysipelotrichaceae bacterium]|nr:AAA family ATPase [Erysipelotrichaceae bacterium]
MGIYFNPGNIGFTKVLKNQIYVDKSLLIEKLNKIVNSNDCYVCFSRPRRFGKSTDAKMLSAYYSKGCDSTLLFNDLKISHESSYQEHLNKYNVIYIDMQYFYNMSVSVTDMIDLINEELIDEINENYHISLRRNKLSLLLNAIYGKKGEQFIFIIDEL